MSFVLPDGVDPVDTSHIRIRAVEAMRKGDWTLAVSAWQVIEAANVLDASDVVEMATALRRLRRFDEANQCLSNGIDRFPESRPLRVAFAWLAVDQRAYETAVTRFVVAEGLYGSDASTQLGLAVALKRRGYVDAANVMLATTVKAYPGNFSVASEYAKLAAEQRKWPEASRRWSAALERFPAHAVGLHGLGQALRELGDFDKAEQVLNGALRRYPNDEWIWSEYSELAVSAGDLRRAIERLQKAREALPKSSIIKNRMGELVQLLAVESPEASCALPTVHAGDAAQQSSELFQLFESLGDNCEFGLVQRHFGCEPLGLLRWTSISPDNLVRALRNRFAGLWHEGNTKLAIHGTEYYLTDTLYGTYMHTFIRSDVDATKLQQQMTRRLQFLVDRLLADLTSGEKIFVYKTKNGEINDAQIDEIFDAIRTLGPNRFLCVRTSPSVDPVVRVSLRQPDLAVGEIASLSPTAFHGEILYEAWQTICRQAIDQLPARTAYA